jgi:hypothetical protein
MKLAIDRDARAGGRVPRVLKSAFSLPFMVLVPIGYGRLERRDLALYFG